MGAEWFEDTKVYAKYGPRYRVDFLDPKVIDDS
jgi:hypothetical protein